MSSTSQPSSLSLLMSLKLDLPESVVSKAKSVRLLMASLISCKNILLAVICSIFGLSGLRPEAIRSALIKCKHSAKPGRNSMAKVVFPAPFGPAMIQQVGISHRKYERKPGWIQGATSISNCQANCQVPGEAELVQAREELA